MSNFYDRVLHEPDEHLRKLKREHEERAAEDFRPLEPHAGAERKAKERRAGMSIAELVTDNLAHPERMTKEASAGTSIAAMVVRKLEERRKSLRANKALDAAEQSSAAVRALLRRCEETQQ
jgi:hypothetical protein